MVAYAFASSAFGLTRAGHLSSQKAPIPPQTTRATASGQPASPSVERSGGASGRASSATTMPTTQSAPPTRFVSNMSSAE